MLKQYHVTPDASTETDLIPEVSSGKAVAFDDIAITALTAAECMVWVYDSTGTKAHPFPYNVGADDPYHDEMKKFITAGAKVTVESDQADTYFSIFGIETDNA